MSVLTPCTCLKFLGMLIDTLEFSFFVPKEKVSSLKELVERLRESPDEATFRKLASVLGKILSMQVAVPAQCRHAHEGKLCSIAPR